MDKFVCVAFTENKDLKSKFENFFLNLFKFSYDRKTFYIGAKPKSAVAINIEERGENISIVFRNWNYNEERLPSSIYLSSKEQINLSENFIGKFALRKKEYYFYLFNPFNSEGFYQKLI
jgi:hypothetical protein